MDLKHYVRVLRAHWVLVLATALVATAAAGVYAFTRSPMYAASTTMFVSTDSNQSGPQAAYDGGLFTQQRVKSYAAIVGSLPVVSAVRAQLHLPETPVQLQAKVSASAPLDTVLVQVRVTDRRPERAALIANAVSQQFALLVNTLETPQGQTRSQVKVSTVQPATAPGAPFSPNKTLDLALGLLLGLALGIGGAVLRATLDASVHSRTDAEETAGAPTLGMMMDDPAARERPLIVQDDRFSPRAEAFRQLRTNLRFAAVDVSLRSLVVTSAVEGEGKTTTAANLAIALAESGEQVILVDADLRRPAVAEMLGLNPAGGLTEVLFQLESLDDALQTYRSDLSLKVLTAGASPPNPSELLGSQRMVDLIAALKQRATTVVFDSPPLLPVTDAAVLAAFTDGAVIVHWVGGTRREQLAAAATSLRNVGVTVRGLVLNRCPRRRGASYYDGYGYGYGTDGYGPRPHEHARPVPAALLPGQPDQSLARSDRAG